MIWRRPVSLIGARVWTPEGVAASVRFGARILDLGGPPRRGDCVIDCEGAWVLPGLVNAHDHLELNHFGTHAPGAPYRHVREWVDAMRPRLESDGVLRAGRRVPLEARVFAGGLKNLLAGTTLVAHHNPLYPRMIRVSPVKVLRRFGWAHSLGMESSPVGARREPGGRVVDRHRATPSDRPFMLHAAEGLCPEAADELRALQAAGVLTANTVLVHVLGVDTAVREELLRAGVSLVWCPVSNLTLFGRTWDTMPGGRGVALGTDSRLTGARDLLDELAAAADQVTLTPGAALELVTTSAARALRAASAGALIVGAPADLVVLPSGPPTAGDALLSSRRGHLELVVTDGRFRLGTARYLPGFGARSVRVVKADLDGQARLIDAALAAAITRYGVVEAGLRLRAAA